MGGGTDPPPDYYPSLPTVMHRTIQNKSPVPRSTPATPGRRGGGGGAARAEPFARKRGEGCFPSVIASLRRECGFRSQASFARAVSARLELPVGQSYIAGVEIHGTPSWQRLAAICSVLECLPSRLVAAAEGLAAGDPGRGGNPVAHAQEAARQIRHAVGTRPGPDIRQFVAPDGAWRLFDGCIGPAIRITRLRMLVSQPAVAAALTAGKTPPTTAYISAVESGRTPVSWSRLRGFCQALQCPPSEVFKAAEQLAVVRHTTPAAGDGAGVGASGRSAMTRSARDQLLGRLIEQASQHQREVGQ